MRNRSFHFQEIGGHINVKMIPKTIVSGIKTSVYLHTQCLSLEQNLLCSNCKVHFVFKNT